MSETIPATIVKNNFGQVIQQATQTGEPIFVEKRGRPVAVILSVESYNQLAQINVEDSVPQLEAAFGLWADRNELDDTWLKESRENWQSTWQDDDETGPETT